jgi:hypothetical protein
MKIDKSDTAVVFIDPQNDVLSEKGLAWPLVHESLQENNTIENMERIFKEAKARGFEVFISPHYFYPIDKGWKFNGPLETEEATSGMFAQRSLESRRPRGFRRRLACAFQALHPGRQNHRCRAASGVGAGDQRPRSTVAQAQDQQDHSWRNAGEHVRRISLARID